jgi:hypothetical protein
VRSFLRELGALVAAGVLALSILVLALRLAPEIHLRLGPGDRDYAHGFSDRFRFDGERAWRRLEGRALVALPLRLEGAGVLTLLARSTEKNPSLLTIRFDDGTVFSAAVPVAGGLPLRWEIPRSQVRAHARLRVEGAPVDISSLRWQSRVNADRTLALAAGFLGALSLLALRLAGIRAGYCLLWVAVLFAGLGLLLQLDSFAAIHLVRRLSVAASLGVPLVALSRLASREASPALRALFFGTFLFKSSLLFHPSFYFFDWPIHETLLELLYHRGANDFRSRLVDYQLAHNIGVAPVGGEIHAFPYPVAFYYAAHAGNSLHHAPELWLKLTAAAFAALALLPLGHLARKLTTSAHADLFACLAYLLVPCLTRSLLLLELSAVAGCFFDLLALAVLATLRLKLDSLHRWALAMFSLAASLAAYTAGFLHFGLLVGVTLVLLPIEQIFHLAITGGSWRARDATLLAFSGIVALGLSLAFAYHPKAVAALATAVLPQGVENHADAGTSLANLLGSAVARARTFLGIPLLAAGVIGLGLAVRRLEPSPLRLLYVAWALSALVAYSLRFVLIDLFQYQKELYWAAALLALGAGALAASLQRRTLAAALLLTLMVSYALQLPRMVDQFYRSYLFL